MQALSSAPEPLVENAALRDDALRNSEFKLSHDRNI
jgi:hypothetical protein